MKPVTVSQLNRFIKALIEEEGRLQDLYVRGEIVGFHHHLRSGHFYFSLKDEQSTIRAVMFRSYAQDLKFLPESGMSVLVRARVGVYERDGAYQLYVTDLLPDGAGALAVAFEQRRAKLAALGLFDESRKKPLPSLPMRIGVITSESGAALQDILQVLSRRWPVAAVVFCPAQVQGQGAAESLVRALRTIDARGRCDVILIGRGGGAAEELWCFNDEALVRAVAGCRTPVVSAVGHETDYTLCDFAADLRAPTPSAAAELAAPSAEQVSARLRWIRERLQGGAESTVRGYTYRLRALAGHPGLRSPMGYVEKNRERLDFLKDSLYNRKRMNIRRLEEALASRAAVLDSLSPLRVLERGYSLVLRDGKAVQDAAGLAVGDELELRFRRGGATAQVSEICMDENRTKRGAAAGGKTKDV